MKTVYFPGLQIGKSLTLQQLLIMEREFLAGLYDYGALWTFTDSERGKPWVDSAEHQPKAERESAARIVEYVKREVNQPKIK